MIRDVSNEARRDALWNAYYDMRNGTEAALQATVAMNFGYSGMVYEDSARRYLRQAAEHLGYTLTPVAAPVEAPTVCAEYNEENADAA